MQNEESVSHLIRSNSGKDSDIAAEIDVIIDRLGHFLISVKKKFDKFAKKSSKSDIHTISKDDCICKFCS